MDEYSFCALGPKHEIIEDFREKDIKPVLPKRGGNIYIYKAHKKAKWESLLKKRIKRQ